MTQTQVIKCISDMMDVEAYTITPATTLRDDLGMDSLDLLENVMAIETEFAIELEDERIAECFTVADVISLVERTVAA